MKGKTHCTIGILSSIQACILFKLPINLSTLVVSAILSLLPDLDEQNSTISNFFVKKKTSQLIFKFMIYAINISIFFVSLKINDNFYISSLITFIAIAIVERKLSYSHLRKLLLSFMFILLALCLYLTKFNIYFVISIALLSIFPRLKHRGFSHSIIAIFVIRFFLKQIEIIYDIDNLTFIGTVSYASHIFLGDLFTKAGVPLFYPVSTKKYSLFHSRVGSFWSNTFEIFIVVFLIVAIVFTLFNF